MKYGFKNKFVPCLILALCLNLSQAFSQIETAPISGNAMATARDGAVPVNFYTGLPSISLPLYKYSGSTGLSLGLSLDYFTGGIRAGELPSSAGLGWNVSVGAVITRTIKGIADDQLGQGFLYSAVLTDDERNKVYDYARSCSDAEQDLFHFNINGLSGSFYIGKNKQIITTPGSRVRISFVMDTMEDPELIPLGDQVAGLRSFTAVTDDGTKYILDNIEYQTAKTGCGNGFNLTYGSSWYVSKIIAPYTTDTIAFSYTTITSKNERFYPQFHRISSSNTHSHSDTTYDPILQPSTYVTTISNRVPLRISLPDSSYIDFVYSKPGQFRYATYPVIQRIKFSDTTFRYGYMFNWDTTNVGSNKRDFLMGLNYYTSTKLMPGYTFSYNTPYLPIIGDIRVGESRDHWGFYNGLNLTRYNTVGSVAGLYTNGVDRSTNSNALASSLSAIKDPSGGTTYYKFENNDVLPVTNSAQYISINAAVSTSTSVTITKDQSKSCPFLVSFSYTFGRSLTIPISGAGNLNFSITSTDGLTTYFTTLVNLKHLYYNGSAAINAVIPSGTYLIKTSLQSGTTSSVSLPIYVSWTNQASTGSNSTIAGGIRIKQITHFDPLYKKTDTIVTYRYVTADGKSSGMGGQPPVYNFTTTQLSGTNGTVTAGAITQNIISNPADVFSFAEPSFVGYKRVEVYKGSQAHNLGKEVYEFSGASEGYINTDPVSFPYLPRLSKDWAAGLPNRISVYDSLGRLIKVTQNTYTLSAVDLSGNTNFRNLKATQVSSGTVSQNGLERVKHYTGMFYSPQMGIAQLTSTVDTFYHPDNSITISKQSMEFDSIFNLKKITTDYDKMRNLNLEKRFYYTYNYNLADGGIAKLKTDSIYTQVASETWITGDVNPRMIAGEITSYSNLGRFGGNAIRPSAHYSFESNKPILQSVLGVFDPTTLVRNTNYWKMKDTIIWERGTLNCIQTTDKRTNLSNSIIYGQRNRKYPIAKVSNATATNVAYTSFEDNNYFGGWTISTFSQDTNSITGKYGFPMPVNITKSSLDPSVTYNVTFWAKAGSSVNVYSVITNLIDSQNGWNYYVATFTGLSSISVQGTGIIDELRLYPKDANMITTTYNDLALVTSTCDANNTIVYNYYDSLNRLILVRDKDKNIIKKYEFPKTDININLNPNWVATNPVMYQCEYDYVTSYNTGVATSSEVDNSPYSETYLYTRYVPAGINYTACPVPVYFCNGNDYRYKFINGVCELACKVYTSSIYKRITDTYTGSQVYRWICTWHYKWSDNSVSPDYTEINTNSCMLTTICEIQ
ncbi:hypothetical protein [Ferruginibacter sp. HRS2-29]|uniref:hypothetical protein n=1 Tax=Ferruginibacter sp. HRS2-29 TaxID=2487334 RepID=UPI0020CEDEA3|nr:hypothetical protein [Ferruginibacter sp. HRS2-29]MCP9750010.1 hypothetical protein [Ferruginibacter sp. HRS2-29]